MKKLYRKTIIYLIAIILLSCHPLSVFASDGSSHEDYTQDERNSRANLMFPILYDGSGVTEYRLFYFAVDTTSLQTYSYGITKSNMQNQGATSIYIDGILTNPGIGNYPYPDRVIRTGLCYYDSSAGVYRREHFDHVTPGTRFHFELCSVSELDKNTTYYAFAKNMLDGTSISGDVAIYYRKV